MYKIPETTLFTGKSLIYVPECHSTNDIAAQMLQRPSIYEGSVIVTDRQLKGRGQRGATWISDYGKNLTISVILKPSFLRAKEQFSLNIAVALAVRNTLTNYLSGVTVKWPNDIMAGDKKISGILIENQIKGDVLVNSIVGIGINVNQYDFPIPTATSIYELTGREVNLQDVLHKVLESIEVYYLRLKSGDGGYIRTEYLNALYWKEELHTFVDEKGEFEGKIKGIDTAGRLHISAGGESRFYAVKEVFYVS